MQEMKKNEKERKNKIEENENKIVFLLSNLVWLNIKSFHFIFILFFCSSSFPSSSHSWHQNSNNKYGFKLLRFLFRLFFNFFCSRFSYANLYFILSSYSYENFVLAELFFFFSSILILSKTKNTGEIVNLQWRAMI